MLYWVNVQLWLINISYTQFICLSHFHIYSFINIYKYIHIWKVLHIVQFFTKSKLLMLNDQPRIEIFKPFDHKIKSLNHLLHSLFSSSISSKNTLPEVMFSSSEQGGNNLLFAPLHLVDWTNQTPFDHSRFSCHPSLWRLLPKQKSKQPIGRQSSPLATTIDGSIVASIFFLPLHNSNATLDTTFLVFACVFPFSVSVLLLLRTNRSS